ncbi:MAG: hypothetical protein EOO16_05935 [Chitinophagaceae bacterium]|nr:MAG: hypothetical protein EOO16_05935 [Chitinophagaceae bacterium]
MKKILTIFLVLLAVGVRAQETERNGLTCVRTSLGGCYNYIIGETCTEFIYHWEICCTKPSFGTGYQVCRVKEWSTRNPEYRLRSGLDGDGVKTTLQDEVKRVAALLRIAPETITTFTIWDSEPVQSEDGQFYQLKPGTYKIDRSVDGWALSGVELILFKRE